MKSNWQPSKCDKSLFGVFVPARQLLGLAFLAALSPATLQANPDGAQIINGHVSIDTSTPGVTAITNSPNAIIQWQNFTIAQNEITQFIQQNSQSAVLNRIIGENPSQILGHLVSNGQVLLINPNGIVFGANSVVDTQGLIASSLNLSDQDFLKGNYHFMAGSSSGNIINEGLIRAGKDGNIVLIAPSITNSGIIKSEGGQITLAAGQELILTNLDDPNIRFEIQAPANTVLNLGKLLTEGGAINVFASTIKQQGEMNADSVEVDAQGHITLVAQQDISVAENSKVSANNSQGDAGAVLIESKAGTVTVSGQVQANAAAAGKGGTVELLGEHVGVLAKANVSANGGQGGGTVLVGGDWQGKNPNVHNAQASFVAADAHLSANATTQGNGGKVVVWADKVTRAYGHLSAKGGRQGGDGGSIETSGHFLDASGIQVDASAPKGNNGQWLLDPSNITIQARGTDTNVKNGPNWTTDGAEGWVTTGSIEAALNAGTSVKVMTGSAGGQDGNILVLDQIVKSSGARDSLTLQAHNSIEIDAPIRVSPGDGGVGALDVVLNPDSDHSGGGSVAIRSLLDLAGGTLTFNGDGQVNAADNDGHHSGVLVNADVAVLAGTVGLNGFLHNIGSITVGQAAILNLNHALAIGTLTNSGTVTNAAYLNMDTLNLNSDSLLQGTGTVVVNQAFNFYSGASLAGAGVLSTATGATITAKDAGTLTLDKQWNNQGAIVWDHALTLSGSGTLNNFAGGAITIKTANTSTLDLGGFNNRGSVELSGGGTLKIAVANEGNDGGSYAIDSQSSLQFLAQSRNFASGASVGGIGGGNAGKVTFAGDGTYTFYSGSHYQANQTVIDGASVVFKTGNALLLPSLTVANGATLNTSDAIEVSKTLNFSSGLMTGSGSLTTPATTIMLLGEGTALLNKNWDNYGLVNFGAGTGTGGFNGSINLGGIRQWHNYGTIAWQGAVSPANNLARLIILTNEAGGQINVASTDAASVRTLNVGGFNNDGILRLSGGNLHIVSPGTDTGRYQVTGTGQLQFADGTRVFNGAAISSQQPVSFSNDDVFIRNGAILSAPDVVLDGSTLTLDSPLSLNKFTLTRGQVNNGAGLTTIGAFAWSGGTLAGAGNYRFTDGFAYTGGEMSATGAITINDSSGSLTLPAMPSIGSLNAHSSGRLTLTGNLNASALGDAIVLAADKQFINGVNALLTTPQGRWLIYSNDPADNVLGALSPRFTHYGCTADGLCSGDGFNVATAQGNGLLYSSIPVIPQRTVRDDASQQQDESVVLIGPSPSTSPVLGTGVGGTNSDGKNKRHDPRQQCQ
ncbi:MAG: filamentous hemagglutinin N-terminal domain-containing protein [Methylovulum sp.]|nr:filamentous hemagglutinin N-terminal domain-containing protein [Methylovulum sp.]